MPAEKPRHHHYVPEFYLAGFTPKQVKDDYLWVYDIARDKERNQRPKEVGHERDYYRIEDPRPFRLESAFSRLEGMAAELTKRLEVTPLGQWGQNDVEQLHAHMALMSVRGPLGRGHAMASFGGAESEWTRRLVSDPELLRRQLRYGGDPDDDANVAEVIERLKSAGARAPTQDDALRLLPSGVRSTAAMLAERHWYPVYAPEDSPLIASDAPVAVSWRLIGERTETVGFGTRGTIASFPLSRRLGIIGAFEPELLERFHAKPAFVNRLTAHAARLFLCGPSRHVLFAVAPDAHVPFDEYRAMRHRRVAQR